MDPWIFFSFLTKLFLYSDDCFIVQLNVFTLEHSQNSFMVAHREGRPAGESFQHLRKKSKKGIKILKKMKNQ